MKIDNILITVLFAFLFVSCSSSKNEEEAIKSQFILIKKSISENNTKELIKNIDKSSIEYFESLVNLLENKSEFKLNNLGGLHDALLNTRLIYQVFERPDSVKNNNENEVEMLITLAKFIGVGILNQEEIERFSFREVESINNRKAVAVIKYRHDLNNVSGILLRYEFKKEEGLWKLDIPSTFKLDEKRLRGPFERGNLNVREFIDQYIKGNVQKINRLRTKR